MSVTRQNDIGGSRGIYVQGSDPPGIVDATVEFHKSSSLSFCFIADECLIASTDLGYHVQRILRDGSPQCYLSASPRR
jgi:hypothetical protein